MTKEEFKRRWELDRFGDGLTLADMRKCAKDWKLHHMPELLPISKMMHIVLKAAHTKDAEDYNPDNTQKTLAGMCKVDLEGRR